MCLFETNSLPNDSINSSFVSKIWKSLRDSQVPLLVYTTCKIDPNLTCEVHSSFISFSPFFHNVEDLMGADQQAEKIRCRHLIFHSCSSLFHMWKKILSGNKQTKSIAWLFTVLAVLFLAPSLIIFFFSPTTASFVSSGRARPAV